MIFPVLGAMLVWLKHRVMGQSRSLLINFLSGGHGPRRPQRWRLHPDRLHPPRQQRLPRFHLLLQDLPARRALWGERVCSQLIIKILFSGLARARSPPSYSLAGE